MSEVGTPASGIASDSLTFPSVFWTGEVTIPSTIVRIKASMRHQGQAAQGIRLRIISKPIR
jgi:hypothetical protein